MFKADIATLFPKMCKEVLNCSIMGRAIKFNLVDLNVYDIRDYSDDKHKKVDDYPYGGGKGMLLKADPIYNCYKHVLSIRQNMKVIYLSPKGTVLTQKKIVELSKVKESIFFICGHYEGIDQRIIDLIIDEEISIGNYVLTGGELAALVLLDAIIRLVPGVLSSCECYQNESHYENLLEYPQYTRPKVWRKMEVPEVLLSGNHEKIKQWRKEKSLEITKEKRPDMLKNEILN